MMDTETLGINTSIFNRRAMKTCLEVEWIVTIIQSKEFAPIRPMISIGKMHRARYLGLLERTKSHTNWIPLFDWGSVGFFSDRAASPANFFFLFFVIFKRQKGDSEEANHQINWWISLQASTTTHFSYATAKFQWYRPSLSSQEMPKSWRNLLQSWEMVSTSTPTPSTVLLSPTSFINL